jgi:MFS transporter, putative metabolite transport protein
VCDHDIKYSTAILGALHMGQGMDVIGSAIITVLFLIGTVVAVLLVNTMSRRRMIIGSFAFSGMPLLLLGIFPDSPGSVALALFAMYVVFLGGTQILQAGYPVEMFPTGIRGTAIGVSFALVNTFTTVGTFLVPIVQNKYGIGITVLSGAILTLFGESP